MSDGSDSGAPGPTGGSAVIPVSSSGGSLLLSGRCIGDCAWPRWPTRRSRGAMTHAGHTVRCRGTAETAYRSGPSWLAHRKPPM